MTTAHDLFLELETSLNVLKNATQFMSCSALSENTEIGRVNPEYWHGALEMVAREANRADTLLSDYWQALQTEPQAG